MGDEERFRARDDSGSVGRCEVDRRREERQIRHVDFVEFGFSSRRTKVRDVADRVSSDVDVGVLTERGVVNLEVSGWHWLQVGRVEEAHHGGIRPSFKNGDDRRVLRVSFPKSEGGRGAVIQRSRVSHGKRSRGAFENVVVSSQVDSLADGGNKRRVHVAVVIDRCKVGLLVSDRRRRRKRSGGGRQGNCSSRRDLKREVEEGVSAKHGRGVDAGRGGVENDRS